MTTQHIRENQRNKYQAFWEFSHGISDVRSIPVQLQIARSNHCNFKCITCIDHRVGSKVPETQLNNEVWKRLESLIPRSESLSFHGISEFMIDPDFFDIVRKCAEAGAALSLNTNGSVCTPKYLDVLAAYPGFLVINFSMDAASSKTYTRMRGWDFRRAVRNIRTYVDHLQSRRDSTKISLSFVIAKSNVHEMLAFVFLAKELNVDAIKYYRMHEYEGLDWQVETKDGSIFNYRAECTSAFGDEFNRQLQLTREASEMLGLDVELPSPFVATAQ